MWAKRPLNGVRKCDGRTNTHTDRHTDIATYRKHRPKGRCFENLDFWTSGLLVSLVVCCQIDFVILKNNLYFIGLSKLSKYDGEAYGDKFIYDQTDHLDIC